MSRIETPRVPDQMFPSSLEPPSRTPPRRHVPRTPSGSMDTGANLQAEAPVDSSVSPTLGMEEDVPPDPSDDQPSDPGEGMSMNGAPGSSEGETADKTPAAVENPKNEKAMIASAPAEEAVA